MSGRLDVPSTPFSIRLFGPFQIEVEGRILPPGRYRKEQWLLTLLLLRQGRAVERDWLASTLWPDSHRSRVQLRDTLYDLRQTLGAQASRLFSPTSQTLQLNVTGVEVDLLEEPQKRLLERLSVFAGGWTLEAAERVCSGEGIEGWEVLDLLIALVDKSLAVYEHREGKARYRLQETVRQYSQERLLESEAAETFRDRHLASFLAFAEEAEPHLKSADQSAWFERLEAEHDNLRAALNSSLGKDGAGDEGLRLCTALWRFWITRGHLSEGLVWCKHVLAGSGSQEPARERANVLSGAGNLALKLGDAVSAGAYFAESLTIRRAVGDRLGIATSLNNLGMAVDTCGDRAATIACFEESLAIHREIGHRSGMAWVLRSLGGITLSQGNDASARPYFEECLAIFREIGERNGIAAALSNLGTIALNGADHVSALAYFEECLSIFREIGELSGIVSSLTHLVLVTAHQGDFAAALAYGDECLLLLKGSSDRRCMVNMLRLCASDAFQGNQCDRAAVLWGAERALWESITWGGEPYSQDRYHQEVAACRQALGEAAFSAAWESGRALSIEKAFQIALDRSSI